MVLETQIRCLFPRKQRKIIINVDYTTSKELLITRLCTICRLFLCCFLLYLCGLFLSCFQFCMCHRISALQLKASVLLEKCWALFWIIHDNFNIFVEKDIYALQSCTWEYNWALKMNYYINLLQNLLRELDFKKPQLDELVHTAESLKTDSNRSQLQNKGESISFWLIPILLCI